MFLPLNRALQQCGAVEESTSLARAVCQRTRRHCGHGGRPVLSGLNEGEDAYPGKRLLDTPVLVTAPKRESCAA